LSSIKITDDQVIDRFKDGSIYIKSMYILNKYDFVYYKNQKYKPGLHKVIKEDKYMWRYLLKKFEKE